MAMDPRMLRLRYLILPLAAFFLVAPNDYEERALQGYLLARKNASTAFRYPSSKSKLRFSCQILQQLDQNEDFHSKDKAQKRNSDLAQRPLAQSSDSVFLENHRIQETFRLFGFFARPPPNSILS